MMEGGSDRDFEDLDNYSIGKKIPKEAASPSPAKNKINEGPKFTESF